MNLNWKDRMFFLGKALTGQLDLKPGSQGARLLGGVLPGAVGAPPVRGTQAMLQGYSSMPWVRGVASRVAHAVASTTWRLYSLKSKPKNGDKPKFLKRKDIAFCKDHRMRKSLLTQAENEADLNEIHDHPLLDLLVDGNQLISGHQIHKMSMVQRDLVGESFWVKERGALGVITGIWPVAPQWIMSTPTPTTQMYRVSFRGWQGFIPATEILWFRDPDPANPYWRGTGVGQSLSDELETDEYTAKYVKQFFFNSARPDIIVSPKGDGAMMGPEEAYRLEQNWTKEHQGFWRAFKPMFAARPLEVTQLENNFRAMQMKDLRLHVRDICLQVWGMPPEIMGIVENSNRATAAAAEYIFSKWVVVPRLEDWRIDFQRLLVPEFDERLIIDYISPIDEEKDFTLSVMEKFPWAFDCDEVRDLAGRSELEDELGSFHMEPSNLTRREDWKKPPEEPKPKVDPLTGVPFNEPVMPQAEAKPEKMLPLQAASWTDEQLLQFALHGLKDN